MRINLWLFIEWSICLNLYKHLDELVIYIYIHGAIKMYCLFVWLGLVFMYMCGLCLEPQCYAMISYF